MPIEGSLRELGIFDVLQLLELSGKTGALTVTASRRENGGHVYLERGAVIFACLRNTRRPLGELLVHAGMISQADLQRALDVQAREARARAIGEVLVSLGALTRGDLEQRVRSQVEDAVCTLLSWRDGYFSFEERGLEDIPAEATVSIPTAALLLEAARRVDEWARIRTVIADANAVPTAEGHRPEPGSPATDSDAERAVLGAMDGARSIAEIALRLARAELDVAVCVASLAERGLASVRPGQPPRLRSAPRSDAAAFVARATAALRDGAAQQALSAARDAVAADPFSAEARLVMARAFVRLGQHAEAAEELRRAARLDPRNADVRLELGLCAVRHGDYDGALASWHAYMQLAPLAPDVGHVRAATKAAARLLGLLRQRAYA
ncbi:MAG: DUF4388 domain-containing protein [Gemmatimonadaceae bacterium]